MIKNWKGRMDNHILVETDREYRKKRMAVGKRGKQESGLTDQDSERGL